MADDRLPVLLEEIRERAGRASHGSWAAQAKSAHDVPRLLAALDAVLKLAADAQPVDRDYGGEPIWWNITPEAIREAVTRALTGEADDKPCKCHQSFAFISPTHEGHCCFIPAGQTCHPEAVAEWERQRYAHREGGRG